MPPRGSHKDYVLRQFVERELIKESLETKLQFVSNFSLNKEGTKDLFRDYKRWVALHFLMDEEAFMDDLNLREDYANVMTLSPKLILTKDGAPAVTGLKGMIKEPPDTPKRR